jgi:phenylalanyl-tRNA synthetase beta chain
MLRELMIASGFSECINYSFLSDAYLAGFGSIDNLIYLVNPISADMNALRPNIFPSLVRSLEYNWNQGERSVKLFEISSVFQKKDDLRLEPIHIAFGLIGDFTPLSWAAADKYDNFYYLKGICNNIFAKLGLSARYLAAGLNFLHPGKSAEVFLDNDRVGFIGALHLNIAEQLDIRSDIYIAELDLSGLVSAEKRKLRYSRFSRFPSVYKDISLVVDKHLQAETLRALILATSPLIQNAALFDIYSGEVVDPQKEKSLTYRIFFSSLDKTLTDEEINPLLYEVESRAAAEFNARLR